MTNGDKIRTMTDEELADWRSDGQCPPTRFFGDYDCENNSCEGCWLSWLKEDAE